MGVNRVGRASRSATSPRRARCSRCKARRAGRGCATISPAAAAVPRFGVRRGRTIGSSPGTGYTGEDGVETPRRRPTTRPRCGTQLLAAGITPAGPRRARHAAARSGPAVARPRARARASRRCRPASAGSCGGTRATSAAGTRSKRERESGPARLLDGLAFAGRQPGRDGAIVSSRRASTSAWSRAATSRRRSGTRSRSRSCSPDVEPGTRSRSTCAASELPATVVKPPFVKRRDRSGRDTRRPARDPRVGARARRVRTRARRGRVRCRRVRRQSLRRPRRRARADRRNRRGRGRRVRDLVPRPSRRGSAGRGSGSRISSCGPTSGAAVSAARSSTSCGARTDGRVEWAVLDWNTPAQDFYRSIGAAPQDEWTTWRWERRPPVADGR